MPGTLHMLMLETNEPGGCINMIDQEKLKEYLAYNKETGLFTRKISVANNKAKKGSLCGFYDKKIKYITIKIESKNYLAHRLAWLYVYGEFPCNQIDHINHNKIDNRICNLRDVTNSENQKNTKLPKNNKTGHIGVYFDKQKNKYRSQINSNGVRYNLGTFEKLNDAIKCRKDGEIKYLFHHNHGCNI